MVDTKRRDRFDIIEKRIGIIETRLNSDNDLAKEMIWSLQQNFEEFNNSMINLKDQMCHETDQLSSVKKEQTNSEKSVEILKSSRVLASLGLNREKQWTRDQVRNLTTQMGEHSDLLDRQFLDLTNQIHLHTDELIKNYSKLRTDMLDKTEREKQWTRDQVKKLTSQVNEQTNQLTNNFSKLRTELIASKEEMESKLNVSKIEMLISAQLKEIETIKKTQTDIENTLISANIVSYTCPSDWTKYSSYCYLYVGGHKMFSEARAHCKRIGATLCDIENEAENSFITSLIKTWTWVGISDEEGEGHWISERTGQPASFTNFGNYSRAYLDNCAGINKYYLNDNWRFSPCSYVMKFICKKDVTKVIKSG
ncbi:CD209 antigen-like protein A [Ruditapes philippinarum]|uniref:CD209 antigen-like protein A n=1 Tax=Ruditapes philippinarum TaxID=129788 RepID=UPI00295AB411|nr:CD209 antigen-like protein A [Ruditapes philippinarum]